MKTTRGIVVCVVAMAFTALAALTSLGIGHPAVLARSGDLALSSFMDPDVDPPPASINIVGQVVDHGGANTATVTVRVGNRTTSSSGTISPQFAATVAAVDLADMVFVEVEGTGFKYVSLLGSYGQLLRQAGADEILTFHEFDALRISPVSTAFQFFVQRQHGGAALTDPSIERAMRSVGDHDLWLATAVMLGSATGSLTIPNGYANAYSLLQDQPAYQAFVMANNAVSGSHQALAAMASTPLTATDLGDAVALVGPLADLDAPMLAPDAEIIERNGATYRVHSTASRKNAEFVGGLEADGALVLTAVNDISTYTSGHGGCLGGNAHQRRRLLGQTYRLQRRSRLADLWMVANDYEVSFPYCNNDPNYPTFEYTLVYFRNAIKLGPTNGPLPGSHALGRRALPVFCVSDYIDFVSGQPETYLSGCEYAPHVFAADGTGQMQELGEKVDGAMLPATATGSAGFTWSSPGSGILHLDDGSVSTRYWTVDSGRDNGVEGVVYVAEALDGSDVLGLSGYVALLDGNVPTGGFNSLSPVGSWRYGTVEQSAPEPYSSAAPVNTSRFIRRADGTATRITIRDGVPVGNGFPSRWSLVDGRLYDVRVLSDTRDPAYDCAEALAGGATKCDPYIVRYFRPLRRVNNRLYGIEEIYVNSFAGFHGFDPPYEMERVSRPNYYELEQPPANIWYGVPSMIERSRRAARASVVAPAPAASK